MSEIITYGAGDTLTHVFNAIAMLMNGSSGKFFRPLMFVGATIGAFWAISKAYWESSVTPIIIQWLIPMLALLTICFVPTSTIHITDIVTRKSHTVDNVPYGLVRTAETLGTIGYMITSYIEQAFQVPSPTNKGLTQNGHTYHKTGMIFGAENLLEISHYAITDELLARNMRDFVHNCVTFDILFGKYSMDQLKNSPNIWELIKNNTSNVRMFTKCDHGKTRCTLVSCKEGASQLHETLGKHIDGLSKHHILQYLPTFYEQLTGMATNATNTISQQVMMHTLVDAIERKCDASNLGTNFAVRRAYMQQRHTYEVVGLLAAKSLVIIRNVLETLIYASFIFIMPLSLLPMGFRAFLKWLWLAVWIQLWPPLYAILNSGIMLAAQHSAKQIIGESTGLTLLTSTGLNNLAIDMQTYATYASLSVPLIAYAILQGGISSFSQLALSLAGVSQSVGSTAAQEQTTGNYSYGQVGIETTNAFSENMLQYQKAPMLSSGFFQENRGDHMTIHGPQSMVMHDSVSQLPFELNASQQISENLRRGSQELDVYSDQKRESLTKGMAHSTRISDDWIEHTAQTKSYDQIKSESSGKSIMRTSQELQKQAESWGKQFNISAKDSISYLSHIGLGLNLPVLKIGGEYQKLSGSARDKITSSGQQFIAETGFMRNYQEHVSLAHNKSMNQHDEKGKRVSETLSKTQEKNQQHQQQIEKNIQVSKNLSRLAEVAENKAVIWNQKFTQEFVDHLSQEKLSNGQIRGRQSAAHLIRHSPIERDVAIRRFLATKEKEFLSRYDLSTEEGFQQACQALTGQSTALPKTSRSKAL